MKTIRWGIIGCGDVCEVKSGPGFYKADNSSLVAVMRRNGALAQDFARRHGVSRAHDDAEAIIQAADIDAVYVATPPATHKDYAVRCARAGKPVYVEKPMALNAHECAEMLAAAHAHQVPLWVGYYRRALPRILKVKSLIDDGAIGTVRAVTVTHRLPLLDPKGGSLPWRIDPAVSGGGLFFDLGCHTLDILDFLLGPVAEAKGFAANLGGTYAAEDTVVAALRFASGAHGTATWNFAADAELEINEIAGSEGRLQFSTYTPSPIRLLRGADAEDFPITDPPHVHQPLIQSIVDEMNGRGHCPSTGESAARTARVMDAIVAEFKAGSGARRP
jgi:1,5-anhydro-D-fructose reductase (1,5-anhydro-D-mannitol-forming)